MGIKWRPLNHGGTAVADLAVIRGAAELVWGSYESMQQYIDSGGLRIVLYQGAPRHPKHPGPPIPRR